MSSTKLTDPFIKNYQTEKSREEISDSLKPGLVLRVSSKGTKTFVFRYRISGKSKRYTIGKYPIISLSKARSIADELYLKTKQEIDPQREKMTSRRTTVVTIEDLAKIYKKRHFPSLKQTTQDDYERRIDNVIVPALGEIPISELSRIEIIDFLEEIAYENEAPIQSNRVRAILSSMYGFAMDKALCEFNPVSTVKPIGEENTRDRVYTEKEIRQLWESFGKEVEPFSSVFKMLLLTGQRLRETRRMKWSDIQESVWIIPEEETKALRTHHVPLSDMVLDILEKMRVINEGSTYVFESPVKKNNPINWLQYASLRVRKASKVSDFRIHDLRRTAATYMTKIGVSRTVLGKVLNHKGLAGDSKVTAVYDRHSYMKEKGEALFSWSEYLQRILKEKNAPILSINSKKISG